MTLKHFEGEAWSRNAKDQLVVGTQVSKLYTWQDGRCSPEFLESLPKPKSHLRKAFNGMCNL